MWYLMDVYIALRYSNEKRDRTKIVQHPQRKFQEPVHSSNLKSILVIKEEASFALKFHSRPNQKLKGKMQLR